MTYCKEVESSTNKRKTFIVEIGFDMESTRAAGVLHWFRDRCTSFDKGGWLFNGG